MIRNKNIKVLSLIVLVALTFMLIGSACSSDEPTTAPAPAPQPAPAAEPQEPQISEEEILMQAAIDYFNYLPQGSNLTFVDPAKSDLVENLANYYVIDIRAAEDYAKGHIPGSVNIPMATLGEAIPTLPTDKTLVLVCYTGRTGNQATGVLRMAGFDALALRGGHEEWVNAGLEIEQ